MRLKAEHIVLLQFLTRPFVVGDRIELKTTSGGTVLIGIVEKIDPMRTVLRTDGTVPVAVPNKAITDMIVSNESRIGRSEVVTEFKVRQMHNLAFRGATISKLLCKMQSKCEIFSRASCVLWACKHTLGLVFSQRTCISLDS